MPVAAPTSSGGPLLNFRGPWDTPTTTRPRNPSVRYDPLVPDERTHTRSALPETATLGIGKDGKSDRSPNPARPSPLLPGAPPAARAQAVSRMLDVSVRTLASSVRTLASSARTLATSVRTLLYGSISHLLDPDASAIGPRDTVSPPRKRARATLLFLLHDDVLPNPSTDDA